MVQFTLIERPSLGEEIAVPKRPSNKPQSGDRLFILNRALVDAAGNPSGSFVLHGTILQVLANGVLLSFLASNDLTTGRDQYPGRNPDKPVCRWCDLHHCRRYRQLQRRTWHGDSPTARTVAVPSSVRVARRQRRMKINRPRSPINPSDAQLRIV
jgi:hypothetical protein